MDFDYSYKRLEKLCKEIYNTDEKHVTAYIEDMKSKPRGSYLVAGWDDDLNTLIYYRYIRNKYSHDPEYSVEDLCTPDDTKWIDNFYNRIMNQTDPLALYRKATESRRAPALKKVQNPSRPVSPNPNQKQKKKSGSTAALTIVLIALLAIIAVLIILYFSDFTTLPG